MLILKKSHNIIMKTQETHFSYLSDADFAITFYMLSYLTCLFIYPSINKLIFSCMGHTPPSYCCVQ